MRVLRGAQGEPLAYLSFVEDITAQKLTLTAIARSERIQRALATFSQRLIHNAHDISEEKLVLAEALELLRDGTTMLRVGVWENVQHPTLGFSARLYAVAQEPGEAAWAYAPGAEHAFPWSMVPDIHVRSLEAGEHTVGLVEELLAGSPDLIEQFRRVDVRGILRFPIMLEGRWWGYLGLNDRRARVWDDQEVLPLRTAAEIISAFLQRNRDVAALRERDAMLHALGDNLPDALIYQLEERSDMQTRLRYLSRGLEQRTGISVEQALAARDRHFVRIHPEDAPAVWAADAEASALMAPFDQEFRYLASDNTVRWMRSRSSPRRLDDRRVLWDGIAVDTTRYHQLQESLQLANQGLYRRVDELVLLNQIAHLITGATELSSTLEMVCRCLCDAFGAVEARVILGIAAGDQTVVAYNLRLARRGRGRRLAL